VVITGTGPDLRVDEPATHALRHERKKQQQRKTKKINR
jgi:hypothetical protein